MEDNLDDVKSAYTNRNPNIKTITITAGPDFSLPDVTEVTEIKCWLEDAIGFKILDWQHENRVYTITLEKMVRTRVDRSLDS